MTTPRIEELENYKEPTQLNGTDYYRLPVNKLEYIIAQAHQAGIDEAVEVAKEHYYAVDVDKEPTIQDEAWANQYENKCEAFWYGEAQGLKALDDTIKALQDNK